MEKPFTLYEDDARTLIALANEKGLKITAGHDDQFSHVARRMRTLVQSGFLGDGPVHMDSYFCYELGRSAYAGALLGDQIIGFVGCRENCCRILSATVLPESRSS